MGVSCIYKVRKARYTEMKNLWKSLYTGDAYEMPVGWKPNFRGWILVGKVTK